MLGHGITACSDNEQSCKLHTRFRAAFSQETPAPNPISKRAT
jgi:hypothetical protein